MFTCKYDAYIIKKALQWYEKTQSFRKLSHIMNIGKSTLHRWWISYHKFLQRAPLQRRKRRCRYKTKYHELDIFLPFIFSDKGFTPHCIKDVQQRLVSISIQHPSHTTIWRYLKKNKITRKYRNIFKVNPYSDHDIKNKWTEFYNRIKNIPDDEIVCIDETAFCNHTAHVQFYLPKGVQVNNIIVPRREKVSFVFCIDDRHIIHYASSMKAFSTTTFSSFFEDLIKNKLHERHKTIIMDNIAFHKSERVKAIAHKHKRNIIFIPPYSPFCNPIEEVFSIMKRRFYNSYMQNFETRIIDAIENSLIYSTKVFYTHTRHELEKRTNCTT